MFKSKLVRAGTIAGFAAVAMAAGVWYFYIRSDAPPPVSLSSAIESLAETPEVTEASATSPASTSTATETAEAGATASDTALPVSETGDGDVAGTWTVLQGDNSFVGYRVDETLAGVGATTAVGRTSGVEGTLEFDGTTIASVEITADLTTLTSDKDLRDGQLRTQAIETGTYPTANFVLTSPIAISEVPADSETVTQTVTGELTLHGVTQTIEIEVEGALENGLLVVVGSTEIQFADYGIEQPVSISVVSIEDHGTMEFQLVFELA
jgi:polyisoprenoid-binding protein YceI